NESPPGRLEMKLALIAAPVVALYSPTMEPFATKRSLPATPIPCTLPAMGIALSGAPVVALNSRTPNPDWETKRLLPEIASPFMDGLPGIPVAMKGLMKVGLIGAPVVAL